MGGGRLKIWADTAVVPPVTWISGKAAEVGIAIEDVDDFVKCNSGSIRDRSNALVIASSNK